MTARISTLVLSHCRVVLVQLLHIKALNFAMSSGRKEKLGKIAIKFRDTMVDLKLRKADKDFEDGRATLSQGDELLTMLTQGRESGQGLGSWADPVKMTQALSISQQCAYF